jgi:hypothetical protein
MMNEAHNRLRRSVRTRRIGLQVVPAAHQAGVRHLAMEALNPWFAAEANETRILPDAPGYLGHPEMRDLIGAALALGWTLVSYEADMTAKPRQLTPLSMQETNWREDQQAQNLVSAIAHLPHDERMLVWCGWGHLYKCEVGDWRPMGLRFREISEIEPFSIDQTKGCETDQREAHAAPWVHAYAREIAADGGAAGFLAEDAPAGWPHTKVADAFILAADNELT